MSHNPARIALVSPSSDREQAATAPTSRGQPRLQTRTDRTATCKTGSQQAQAEQASRQAGRQAGELRPAPCRLCGFACCSVCPCRDPACPVLVSGSVCLFVFVCVCAVCVSCPCLVSGSCLCTGGVCSFDARAVPVQLLIGRVQLRSDATRETPRPRVQIARCQLKSTARCPRALEVRS